MNDDESFEAELRESLRPAAPPADFARRLAREVFAAPSAKTRPAPAARRRRWSERWNRDASSFLRWLAWTTVPLTAAVALTLFLRPRPPQSAPSAPPSFTADAVSLEREVLRQSDGGIVELPGARVVRLVRSDEVERVTLRDTRTGAMFECTMPTARITPVRVPIY